MPQSTTPVKIGELQIHGKWILFCCVGTDVTKYEVYEHVHKLGANIVIIDVPDCRLGQMLQDNKIANLITLDMTSRPSLVQESIALIDKFCLERGIKLDGITTFWDDAVCLSCRLAHHYGLIGNPIHSVDLAHDKSASRQFLSKLGYAGPNSFVVSSVDDVEQASDQLNFPAIMKPLYGAASIGVRKVNTPEEAAEHYKIIQDTLDIIYAEGELMGLTFDDADADIAKHEQSLRQIVFEEFLVGPEFDCDVALMDGEVVYCNIMDDWEFEEPHFIEIGSSCPSTRPIDIQSQVREFGPKVLSDMGFTDGVFHVEIIHDTRLGPCLVEVNPRMGGGPVRSIHKTLYGVDLCELVIASALGIKMKPTVSKSPKSAVTINLFAKKSGSLKKSIADCQEFLNTNDAVVSKHAVGEEGDIVTGWHDGYPSALGRVNFMIDDEVIPAVQYAKSLINTFYEKVEANTA